MRKSSETFRGEYHLSAAKRLGNDVDRLEKASDWPVPSDSFLVIHLHMVNENGRDLPAWPIRTLLNWGPDGGKPLVVYECRNEVWILFSSISPRNLTSAGKDGGVATQETHICGGSIQRIVSEMASWATLRLKRRVYCAVTPLESRVMVLSFFHIKAYRNVKASALALASDRDAKAAVPEDKIDDMTIEEMRLSFEDRGINWDEEVPLSRRVGTFHKLNGKTMCEILSGESYDRYSNFFFSR